MQDADDRIEIAKLNFKISSDNLKSAAFTPVAPVDDFRFETERGLAEGGGSEMAQEYKNREIRVKKDYLNSVV